MEVNWKRKFEREVQRLTSIVTFTDDYKKMNYRLDILGCEPTYKGFALIVLYYQLSPALNISFASQIVSLIGKNAGPPHIPKFLQFFMNDEDGNLIFQEGSVPLSQAIRLLEDYYKEYAFTNETYSRVLKQLHPPHQFSRALNVANARKQLFVIVHDKNGIIMAPEVIEHMKKFANRWLFVCLDVNCAPEIKDFHNYFT
jgi:hypothetical protein